MYLKFESREFSKISFPNYWLKNGTSFFGQPTNPPCPTLSFFALPTNHPKNQMSFMDVPYGVIHKWCLPSGRGLPLKWLGIINTLSSYICIAIYLLLQLRPVPFRLSCALSRPTGGNSLFPGLFVETAGKMREKPLWSCTNSMFLKVTFSQMISTSLNRQKTK